MKILLSTNVKDEHNIMEWIDFHQKVGFTHLLIWDDMSETPVVFDSNQTNVVVRREHALKPYYMEQSLVYAREHEIDFMIHLDGDEYLYLGWTADNRPLKITEYLESIQHSEVMAIYLPWLMMGSNGHERSPPPGSCLRYYTKSDYMIHFYIKQLARVSAISGILSAHEYVFHQPCSSARCVDSSKQPLTRFFSMTQPSRTLASRHMPPCIVHFRNQSWDHFRHRRSNNRPRDDTGKPWQKNPAQQAISFDSPTPPPAFIRDCNSIDFPYVLEYYTSMVVASCDNTSND